MEVLHLKVSRKNSLVKYFSGKVSDGVKTVRVVLFEPCLNSEMEKSRVEGSAVSELPDERGHEGATMIYSGLESVDSACQRLSSLSLSLRTMRRAAFAGATFSPLSSLTLTTGT